MDFEKLTRQTGVTLFFAVAGCAASGQRGRAVILWFIAVCLVSCSIGIHVMKK